MERLEIKNFGPISEATINISVINIFIGQTSSGKSAISKLCAVLKDYEFISKVKKIDDFKEHLNKYNIGTFITNETYIRYESDLTTLVIKGNRLNKKGKDSELLKAYNALLSFDKLSKSISDLDNLDINVFSPIFIHLHTLTYNIIKEVHLLPYKQYYRFIKILEHTNELYKNFDEDYDHDTDKASDDNDEDSNNDSDGYCMDYHTTEPVLEDIQYILFLSISFFGANIKELQSISKPIYIPAERIIFSLLSENIFSISNQQISIPKSLLDFGSIIERAKKAITTYKIDFLELEYKKKEQNYIVIHKGLEFSMNTASSGIQTIIPLYLTIDYTTRTTENIKPHFIVEEPELNLYPTQQKSLIENIIEKCIRSDSTITITTHSPYVLTTINNLIQASNAVKSNPNKKYEIEKIINKNLWIDFEQVTAYYINNGTVTDILDYDISSIGANNIDDISEEIGNTFGSLTDITYA